jgi:hypothetical protein
MSEIKSDTVKMIRFFAAVTRALSHNGALEYRELNGCKTLIDANNLLAEKGREYNERLPENLGWMAGIEGWRTDHETVHWRTGTGRMQISIDPQTAFIRFESGETVGEDHTVCEIKVNKKLEIEVLSRTRLLTKERIDRVSLLEDIYLQLGKKLDVMDLFFGGTNPETGEPKCALGETDGD